MWRYTASKSLRNPSSLNSETSLLSRCKAIPALDPSAGIMARMLFVRLTTASIVSTDTSSSVVDLASYKCLGGKTSPSKNPVHTGKGERG